VFGPALVALNSVDETAMFRPFHSPTGRVTDGPVMESQSRKTSHRTKEGSSGMTGTSILLVVNERA
jgi:hypothetical protein